MSEHDTSLHSTTAFILAGGLGTRLQAVVSDRPKALAVVRGRPFLDRLLLQIANAGLCRVILCVGHRAEQVRDTYGPRFAGLELVYSVESSPLGTGGALALAHPLCVTSQALIFNGDSFCDVSLPALRSFHDAHGEPVTLVAAHQRDTSRFGTLELDESGRVLAFGEKRRHEGPGWINAGVYLTSTDRLRQLPPGRPLSLEREVFPSWVVDGMVAFRTPAEFLDIGTPASYGQADAFFAGHSGVQRSLGRNLGEGAS